MQGCVYRNATFLSRKERLTWLEVQVLLGLGVVCRVGCMGEPRATWAGLLEVAG